MKTLILAAGRSRRAKPIEDKNFLTFCGKTLIEHQLQALTHAGLTDILIMSGAHNIERLQELANPFNAKVLEQENLDEGMAGAILSAEENVGDTSLFIVSSNDVVDEKAYELMKAAADTDVDAALLAYKVDSYFPGGFLNIEDGRITGIIEKPGEGNEPSNFVNLVLHFHKNPKELISALKEVSSDKDDRYEVALNKLMKKQNFTAIPYDGYWQPVKFPWHVLDLMNHYLDTCEGTIDPSAEIADSAVIRGNVTIAAGVKVFDNAVIQGPAYIGENSVIANNALVRGSILGKNCVLGYSTEIARSYVGSDTWFHSNYVGDSVIGNNCSFGAGAVCANLRLDEKEIADSKRNKLGPILGDNIRVGVNTSLMPAVRIGSGTMITSGLVIAQDIEPNKFVSGGKIVLDIKENRAKLDDQTRTVMKAKL